MAKINMLETAKDLEKNAKALIERMSGFQAAVGETLHDVRLLERELREKESIEARARLERERKERLLEVLSSDKQLAVHYGADDEDEIIVKEETPVEASSKVPGSVEKTSAQVEAKEIPAQTNEKKTETPEPGVTIPEQRAKAETKAEPVKGGYEQHAIDPSMYNKQQNQQRPAQRQTEWSADRPQRQQSGGFAQQRQGGQQTGGFSQQRQGGQQGGGFAPRQGGQQSGGFAPRQGGQQSGGFAPRQGGQQSGGFAPRQGGQQAGGFSQQRQGAAQGNTGYSRKPAVQAPAGNKEKVSNYDPNRSNYTRNYEAEKRARNKKSLQKEAAPVATWDDDTPMGSNKRRPRKQQPVRRPEPIVIEKAVVTTEKITVKDLSEKIGKPAGEIIKKLFLLGVVATINQDLDFDTVELIANDYGITVEQNIAKTFEEVLQDSSDEEDSPEMLDERPPVVTIMGHVDHGKTSLLDAIRNSQITQGEAGGITQHIGAYMVERDGKNITFIDTPGHEAFTSMRARGAQVTDIVILVVAADDGIKPQTIEAINHAKAAEVPIIVAINKMDRAEANPDRVMQQLTEYSLVPEDWGGDTICVPVSAKTHSGLDTLLEMILLQAEVLELKANASRLAKGTIVEAQLDKGRGPVATVLVQNGTLHVGDTIVAGTTYGRVRAMMDDKGRRVKEAGPSHPVEVLGFNEVPSAGDTLNVAEIDKLSRQVAEERRDKLKAEQLKNLSKVSLDDLFSQIADGEIKDLNIIVKADVQGSVEAVKQALEKLSNEEVRVRCIHGGVGAITGSDIMFATASNAIVIGFNVRMDATARLSSEREKVDVRMYSIIYNAIEDVESAMKGLFKPVFKEVELGRVVVRETFKVSGVGTIAGAYVQEGKINRNAQVRVVRGGIVIHEGKMSSLKRFKDDAKEVAAGFECGVGIEKFNDLQIDDIIEAYEIEEIKR